MNNALMDFLRTRNHVRMEIFVTAFFHVFHRPARCDNRKDSLKTLLTVEEHDRYPLHFSACTSTAPLKLEIFHYDAVHILCIVCLNQRVGSTYRAPIVEPIVIGACLSSTYFAAFTVLCILVK